MAKMTQRSGANRTQYAVGTAKIQLSATIKGAWRTKFEYLAFGQVETKPGPSGLGQFVTAQLVALGVENADQAALVRFLADPPTLHKDTELPDAFDRLGIQVHTPTGELLSGFGVDAETVSQIANGNHEWASVPKGYEDQLLELYREQPSSDGTKAQWRSWYQQAAKLPLVIKPRGFEVPEGDPLNKAYEFMPEPTSKSTKSSSTQKTAS